MVIICDEIALFKIPALFFAEKAEELLAMDRNILII